MDKQIRKIERDTSKLQDELKSLEKLDKKRDPACDLGKSLIKSKAKRKKK